jgi:hypothetical protein
MTSRTPGGGSRPSPRTLHSARPANGPSVLRLRTTPLDSDDRRSRPTAAPDYSAAVGAHFSCWRIFTSTASPASFSAGTVDKFTARVRCGSANRPSE